MKKLIACIVLSAIGLACEAGQLTSFGACTQRAQDAVSACYPAAESRDPDRTEGAELQCDENYRAELGRCNQTSLATEKSAKEMLMPITPSALKP
jgi:hypothetical protein